MLGGPETRDTCYKFRCPPAPANWDLSARASGSTPQLGVGGDSKPIPHLLGLASLPIRTANTVAPSALRTGVGPPAGDGGRQGAWHQWVLAAPHPAPCNSSHILVLSHPPPPSAPSCLGAFALPGVCSVPSNSTSFVSPRLLGEAGCPRAAGPPLLLLEPCPTLPAYPQCQRSARNQWRKKGVKGGPQRHQAWPCPGLSRQLPWEGFPGGRPPNSCVVLAPPPGRVWESCDCEDPDPGPPPSWCWNTWSLRRRGQRGTGRAASRSQEPEEVTCKCLLSR